MIEKAIGKRIQEYRKKKGLTQEQLAEKIEISPHYLSALERGIYNIKLDTLVAILNTLECSADEIFCDVVVKTFVATANQLSERIKKLPFEEQKKIYAVIDTMIKNAIENNYTHN